MDIRLKRAYEPASPSDGYRVLVDLATRGLKEAAQARRVGEGAAAEHRTQRVVRARAEPLRRVPPALHQRAAQRTPAANGAQATSKAGDAHARLLRPRHRTQRRSRARRRVAPRTAAVGKPAVTTTKVRGLKKYRASGLSGDL